MRKTHSGPVAIRFLGMAVLACAGLQPAMAGKNRPAPIVFADQDDVQRPATESQTATPVTITGPSDRTARLSFKYPEAGQGGEAASEPVPQSQPAARQYAAVPSYEQYSPQAAPAPTPQAIAEAAERTGPIRITARKEPEARPVGRPLTLSTVSVSKEAALNDEIGIAGLYADGFHGKPTANGEIFDDGAMTAAHPSLPLPSLVQVINIENGREVVVRVNDRGPFAPGKMIDLSSRAASILGIDERSQSKVKLRYLGPAPVETLASRARTDRVVEETMTAPVTRPAPVRVTQPAPSPLAARPLPVAASSGNIFIQAGSFADISNAQSMNTALGRQLPVKIEPARVNNADYFRVLVGPFKTRREAEVYRQHLDQSGITKGFIVTR